MIIDLFLIIIYYFVLVISSPLRLLPDVTADSSIVTSVTTAISNIASLNYILPLDTIMSVLASTLAIEAIIALYKLIMWVIRRLPTQS